LTEVRNLLDLTARPEVAAYAVTVLCVIHYVLTQALGFGGAWVGSLGNTYFRETLTAYLITLAVLVALAVALAALIRGEIRGRRGGVGRGRSSLGSRECARINHRYFGARRIYLGCGCERRG